MSGNQTLLIHFRNLSLFFERNVLILQRPCVDISCALLSFAMAPNLSCLLKSTSTSIEQLLINPFVKKEDIQKDPLLRPSSFFSCEVQPNTSLKSLEKKLSDSPPLLAAPEQSKVSSAPETDH
jgi:hypothetical protein